MAELPDVVPGEPIDATSFGNPVLQRVLSRYSDSTARDVAVPLPVTGDFAYLETERKLQVYDTNLGRWVDYMPTLAGQTVEAPLVAGGVLRRWNTDGDTGNDRRFEWRRSASFGELELYGVDGSGVSSLLMAFQADSGGIVKTGTQVLLDPGTQAKLALSWTTDQNTGVYLAAAGNMQFWAGDQLGLAVRTDRLNMDVVLLDTTGVAANMHIQAGDARVQTVTSGRKYKTDIAPAPQLADLELEPVSFYRADDDRDGIGFIAEDLAAQDQRLALLDGDGEVQNYDDRGLMAVLAAKVNRLEAQVAKLTKGK